MLTGSYDLFMVFISFCVAVLASYTALDLSGRIATSKKNAVPFWISGGALAMGIGIWSMHFVGMLAFSLPIPMGYDLTITLLSLALAIIASGFALWMVAQPEMPWSHLLIGAVALGAGIAAMHYLGMYALLMQPGIVYDPLLVGLSLVIAVIASASALLIAFRLRRNTAYVKAWRMGASLVMGGAIIGMHYTGMAAAGFPEGSFCAAAIDGLDNNWLASLVIVVTLAVLGIALLTSVLDARMELRTDALSRSLADANKELTHLALHDNLTKLPNRLLLEDRIEQSMQKVKRNGGIFTLMFLDLDGFKPINDAFGHHVGDKLLEQVGQRLTHRLRATDTLARVGGDEFVLLAEVDTATDASSIAKQIIDLVNQPFRVDEQELRVSTSLGIVMYPADGTDQQELLMNADAAMYHAKASGKNDFSFFNTTMNAGALAQLNLLQDLRRALQQDEFVLYYQPKFAAVGGQIVGAEALIRWHHPTRGLLAPGAFIGLAEKSGLIVEIDSWVLKQACQQMGEWYAEGYLDWCVAVNVSALQLSQPRFVDSVQAALEQNALPAKHLIIEITETMAMNDVDASIKVLERLGSIGVGVSIDDFGSGHSSLLYLKNLPVNELKIDRGFVNELQHGAADEAIISAIVDLGQALGLRIVAEGVETAEQQAFLSSMKCDVLQGFLLGHPLPADDFIGKLAGQRPKA
ncbi:putative bifunctional diguanylate cyclase/phosphodiesterase [Halopseudomonas sp.]|jgi:diguanylate cyclase (GGDEF)-like protein|uniref:putative bifunctional diguanylate cyclase/phosphodiesterase n=1 Tax=Halopseudomonas sp. TaxID=2901191 RepID=UPI0039E4C55B